MNQFVLTSVGFTVFICMAEHRTIIFVSGAGDKRFKGIKQS